MGARLSIGSIAFACLGFVLLLGMSHSASAQIPDEFTNLKVLDSAITKDKLMDKMKDFCISLDVRCEFCHKGNSEEGFKSFDFTSDEKEHKKTARRCSG